MTIHTQTDPDLDGSGRPVFPFEGCHCPGCMILRAQYDSYKVHAIARVGRLLQRARTRMRSKDQDEFRRAVEDFRYLYHGAREALEKWAPALPARVH